MRPNPSMDRLLDAVIPLPTWASLGIWVAVVVLVGLAVYYLDQGPGGPTHD